MSIHSGHFRQPRAMTRRPMVALATLVVAAVMTAAQGNDPLVQVVDVKRATMSQEMSSLAAGGYDIALAGLKPGVVIAHKSGVPVKRSYLFIEDVGTLLQAKRLEPGYRILPHTFGPGGTPYSAVFEKTEGDEQLREYVVLTAGSPGELEKKARAQLSEAFVPVAIDAENAAAAVFEKRLAGSAWQFLSTRRMGTMEQELALAATEGYRITAASGGAELVFALVRTPDAQPSEYRLVSTTRSVTLEKEMNEAATAGWRFVPGSLAALRASSTLFGGRAAHEAAVVMERLPETRPVTYRVVGARRIGTIERESLEPAAQGFALVAALVGYEETVVIFESPVGRSATER